MASPKKRGRRATARLQQPAGQQRDLLPFKFQRGRAVARCANRHEGSLRLLIETGNSELHHVGVPHSPHHVGGQANPLRVPDHAAEKHVIAADREGVENLAGGRDSRFPRLRSRRLAREASRVAPSLASRTRSALPVVVARSVNKVSRVAILYLFLR